MRSQLEETRVLVQGPLRTEMSEVEAPRAELAEARARMALPMSVEAQPQTRLGLRLAPPLFLPIHLLATTTRHH